MVRRGNPVRDGYVYMTINGLRMLCHTGERSGRTGRLGIARVNCEQKKVCLRKLIHSSDAHLPVREAELCA